MTGRENKRQLWSILGLCALIAVLVGAVQLIFRLIPTFMPAPPAEVAYPINTPGGVGSEYSLFDATPRLEEEQVEGWLERAEDWEEESAYFLICRDSGEYLLYLPMQERSLTNGDMTAEEKPGEDGKAVLTLRLRTSEQSHEVEPEEQILGLRTTSESWEGSLVRIILDGRELNVYKCILSDGELYWNN